MAPDAAVRAGAREFRSIGEPSDVAPPGDPRPSPAPVSDASSLCPTVATVATGVGEVALAAVRSVSVGTPQSGALRNAVPMREGEHWVIAYPDNAWATHETVTYLRRALDEAFDGAPREAPRLYIGDLSTPWGGPLPPHASHQSGRDADVGYARRSDSDPWWEDASERTLDVALEWRLVRALVKHAPVEVIFMDRAIQRLIRAHARRVEADARWVDRLFDLGGARPSALVRHAPGHASHIHVRFHNPVAQRAGRVVREL